MGGREREEDEREGEREGRKGSVERIRDGRE